MKKVFNIKNLYNFVFATFVLSAIYVSIRIVASPSTHITETVIRVKSDYIMLLLQCLFGMGAMLLPSLLNKKIGITIPTSMLIIYALFLYSSIYLGDVRAFFYKVPHWDTILHTFSGVALGALGFSVVSLLNKSKNIQMSLSPAFVAIFAFCFALSLGTIWEVYEFVMDLFLDSNMQTYALENGTPLIGQAALVDTMKDLIVDALGAFSISVIGYISLKHEKGWLSRFQLK